MAQWLKFSKRALAFTLLEVLIAMTLLGVIATFAIPKVLQSTNSSKYESMGKEMAATLTGALQAASNAGQLTANTGIASLTPYINYVSIDTTTANALDGFTSATGCWSCTSGSPCLRFHNGSIAYYPADGKFNGTTSLHMIYVNFDPSGACESSTSTTGPSKNLSMWLYYDGSIRTFGTGKTGTQTYYTGSPQALGPDPSLEPSWFSWN